MTYRAQVLVAYPLLRELVRARTWLRRGAPTSACSACGDPGVLEGFVEDGTGRPPRRVACRAHRPQLARFLTRLAFGGLPA